MSNDWFAQLRFEGERFRQKTLPVGVLGELATYSNFVFEVARLLFRERHPEKRWHAQEILKKFQLHLSHIEDGSAVPCLVRQSDLGEKSIGLFPEDTEDVDYDTLFEDARDQIESWISGAYDPKTSLPPISLSKYFEDLGSRTHASETLTLKSPRNPMGVSYDSSVRERFRVLFSMVTYREETMKAVFRSYTKATNRFQVELENGKFRTIDIKPSMKETILEAAFMGVHNPDKTIHLLVSGLAQFDQTGRFLDFQGISEVEMLPDPDMPTTGRTLRQAGERLAELAQLQDGWLDGEGRGIDLVAAGFLTIRLQKLVLEYAVPVPYLYPTLKGGIQAEWTFGSWEISATFDLEKMETELFAVDVSVLDKDVFLEKATGLKENWHLEVIAQFVLQFIGS